MSDTQTALGGVAWLDHLGAEDRRALAAGASVSELPHGASVPLEDFSSPMLVFVVRGAVKLLEREESGKATILQIYAAGELVDAARAWLGTGEPGSLVVLGDATQLLFLRQDRLRTLAAEDATLACNFTDELAAGAQKLRSRLGDMAVTPVPRRIARVLSHLAASFGAPGADGGVNVELPLSRQDVADLCGTTIETAIRVMSRLQAEGILRKARHGVHIADVAKLEALSAGEQVLRAR